jgi:diguanylate cyclase (GGDEF)-like protein
MNTTLIRTDIWMVAARNYWWAATATGVYFAGGFVLWHGSEGALASGCFFLFSSLLGFVVHGRMNRHNRLAQIGLIVGHLIVAQGVLVWQKAHLPLSDYTATGNPATRSLSLYLVSIVIVTALAMFGGIWGAMAGLVLHYASIFNLHNEFSLEWIFPVLMALGGMIVSNAFWRLDKAYEQLENFASRDPLTGLLNRRCLDSEFTRLQALERETGKPLLLVAWDLDGLKQINDQHGHAEGDAYILNFAASLATNIRRDSALRLADAAFRVGGDEFVSMHLDIEDGATLVERVRFSFPMVSAGWVSCAALNLDQALTRADEALYRNKQGRKRALAGAVGG